MRENNLQPWSLTIPSTCFNRCQSHQLRLVSTCWVWAKTYMSVPFARVHVFLLDAGIFFSLPSPAAPSSAARKTSEPSGFGNWEAAAEPRSATGLISPSRLPFISHSHRGSLHPTSPFCSSSRCASSGNFPAVADSVSLAEGPFLFYSCPSVLLSLSI